MSVDNQIKLLQECFSIKQIQFKPQAMSKDGQSALLVVFIDARDVAQRLDDVVGPQNWQFSVAPIPGADPAHIVGNLSVKFDDCEWVVKSDVGEAGQDPKSYKAAVSDALKRCAVQYGVFRYAYDMKFGWCKKNPNSTKRDDFIKPNIPYKFLSPDDTCCEVCGAEIKPTYVGKDGVEHDSGDIISLSYYRYGSIYCMNCWPK